MSTTTRLATTFAANTLDANWRLYAACAKTDPELFHPVGTSKAARQQAEKAKQVCAGCPVRAQCLQWALDTHQDDGVAGGLSEEERRRLHRRRRRFRAETSAVQHIIDYCLDDVRQLVDAGLEPLAVAREMGTNVQTVNKVLERLAVMEQAGEVAAA